MLVVFDICGKFYHLDKTHIVASTFQLQAAWIDVLLNV